MATTLRARRAHGYESSRPDIEAHVPVTARNVLELGCSTGALGAAIKARQSASVLGVEINEEYAEEARARLDRVVAQNAEAFAADEPPSEAPFDCLIAADVLEHLEDPWATLRRAVAMLEQEATVIVSVPNAVNWKGLLRIARTGRWPRDDEGVFDRTHLRWFGPEDAADLLRSAGLEVRTVEPRYWVAGRRLTLVKLLARTRLAPLLPFQIIVVGRKPQRAPVDTRPRFSRDVSR
jgi:trans-aconitate methyltransferase